jgi:hypothetical protein
VRVGLYFYRFKRLGECRPGCRGGSISQAEETVDAVAEVANSSVKRLQNLGHCVSSCELLGGTFLLFMQVKSSRADDSPAFGRRSPLHAPIFHPSRCSARLHYRRARAYLLPPTTLHNIAPHPPPHHATRSIAPQPCLFALRPAVVATRAAIGPTKWSEDSELDGRGGGKFRTQKW